jgi:hypothetical protein
MRRKKQGKKEMIMGATQLELCSLCTEGEREGNVKRRFEGNRGF